MKILLLLSDLFESYGGIPSFNRVLVHALNEISKLKNHQIAILVLNDKGNSELKKKYIPGDKIIYKKFNGNKLTFASSTIKEVKDKDIVFVGHVNFLPLLLIANSKTLKRYLIVHGIEAWKKLSWLKQLGLRKIDKILSVSNFTKDKMIKHNNIDENKFKILYNTLDPFYEQEINQKDKIQLPTGKIILTVSRLDAKENYKNIDKVIKAMPEILKKVPDAYYIIVGDGTDRKRLENLVRESNLNGKVIFTGLASNSLLKEYYKNADVFVLPSTGEGFGIVFLEAMYFSKACIGADIGGIPEVIKNGETGILCNPYDTNNLVDSITKLLEDDNLRSKLGKNGKERVEKEFSFEEFKNRLEKILQI